MTRGNSNPKRRRIRTAIRKAARKTGKWGGAVVSVLLLVAWIGSGWYRAEITWFKPNSYVCTTACKGTIYVFWGELAGVRPYAVWSLRRATGRQWERWLSLRGDWGVGRDQTERTTTGVTYTTVAFPIWLPLVVVLASTSLVWYLDIRAMRRARVGQCAACGYDLAGTAAGAVCPECGKARSA